MLAADAATAGMLEALLASAAAHKSAAAVGAAASCLLAMCLAAPDLREQLGNLPGAQVHAACQSAGGVWAYSSAFLRSLAVTSWQRQPAPHGRGTTFDCMHGVMAQHFAERHALCLYVGAVQQVVDLLGPPPATVIPWEQQQLALQAAAAASTETEPSPKQQHPAGRVVHPTTSSIRMTSGNTATASSVGARSRSGAVQDAQHTTEGEAAEKGAADEQQGMARTRRK